MEKAIILLLTTISNSIQELCKPRTIFALMIYFTVCYLAVTEMPMDDVIADAFFVLMGYWFGERQGRKFLKEVNNGVNKEPTE